MKNYFAKLAISFALLTFNGIQGKLIGLRANCECGVRLSPENFRYLVSEITFFADLLKKTFSSLRIVNGSESNPDSHPWLVSIYIGKNDPYPSCGGVLVSNLHVLTAGHCIKSNPIQICQLISRRLINESVFFI